MLGVGTKSAGRCTRRGRSLNSGFTLEQFELLKLWGGAPDGQEAEVVAAREILREAHHATKVWADLLKHRLFPEGEVSARRAPINQGRHFSRYTWAKLYPSASVPRELAFTVGIDEDGTFIVKIDVVGPRHKPLYRSLFGDDFAQSPIAAVLPAELGLKLSLEQLVEWSVEALAAFTHSYDDVARMLGVPKPLTFITYSEGSARGFADWRQAMLEGSIDRGKVIWCPDVMLTLGKLKRLNDGRYEVPLGFDHATGSTVVSINEPSLPGGRHGLSNIAIDDQGRRFLMHQAKLSAAGDNISAELFLGRTGLAPTPVETESADALRTWFVVAALDQPAPAIRRETAVFVHQCRIARADPANAISTSGSNAARPGADEVGGSYVIGPRDAMVAQIVQRRHGIIYLTLQELLGRHKIVLDKLMHPLGFEIDGQIVRSNGAPLLIEIKTAVGSTNLHTGVGQLHLYPRLLPELANHKRVLLLPSLPDDQVLAAIQETGIDVHSFNFPPYGDGSPTFSREFLELCGVPH